MDYSELKYDVEEFESDQDKKLPQPPLVKEATNLFKLSRYYQHTS